MQCNSHAVDDLVVGDLQSDTSLVGLRRCFVAMLPGQETPRAIESISACGRDVYIAERKCWDFLYTPAGDPVVEVGM
jgi:hypothetical protein